MEKDPKKKRGERTAGVQYLTDPFQDVRGIGKNL